MRIKHNFVFFFSFYQKGIYYEKDWNNKIISWIYRKNNKSNRYGITVPKKTGPAVTRNKIKRRVKNIIDNNKKVVHNGYDYVIIIKKGILELTYKEMEKELLKLISIGDKIE